MGNAKADKILVIKPAYDAWPVGYAYVLGCLESENIPFDFIDSSRSDYWVSEVIAKLRQNDYLAVTMGGLIGFYDVFKTAVDLVHKHNKGTPFLLGGNITKDAGDELLFDKIGITFGLVGEAETSLPQFIAALKRNDNDFSAVPGLIYRNPDGSIVRNPTKRLDLKQNNVRPAWHHFDADYYIDKSSWVLVGSGIRAMPILSGRGCIGKCGFCSPSIGGFRKRHIEDVISEIEEMISKYDFDCFVFYNEMFYPTIAEIVEFCRHYKLVKNRKPWITGLRIDANIDPATLIEMKEAGCIVIGVGIESGSEAVLKRMKKRITPDQIRSCFQNARLANMPTHGTFIVGYEGETEADLKETIDILISEEICADACLMFVYPGTEVYTNAVQRGSITDEMFHLGKIAKSGAALFSPFGKEDFLNISGIPDNDFLGIATREVRRYYTFVFNRYSVSLLSAQIKINKTNASIQMIGECRECHQEANYEYEIFKGLRYTGFLGVGIYDRLICQKCYNPLSFDIYNYDDKWQLPAHFSALKNSVNGKKKIVIAGINEDLTFLLRINLLNINYDDVVGIMALNSDYINKKYLNFPVLDLDDVVALKPDCILWLDILSDPHSLLNKFKRKNIAAPEILNLFSPQLQESLMDVRDGLKNNGGTEIYYVELKQFLKSIYLKFVKACDNNNITIPRFIKETARYVRQKYFVDA